MLKLRIHSFAHEPVLPLSLSRLVFIHNHVFGTDTLFIRTKKHGWRAQRAMTATPVSIDLGRHLGLQRSSLRGRPPVRADRRLWADEKHIRPQSAIL